MAYREPFFVFEHYLRDTGNANVTLEGGEASGFPKFRLLDNDPGPLFKWSASAADNAIIIDRGGGTLQPLHYILIPANHNLSGTLHLEDNAIGTGGPWDAHATKGVTVGEQVEWNTPNTSLRFLRLRVAATVQGELSEVSMGQKKLPAEAGPDPAWEVSNEPNIQETLLRSGKIRRLETGSPRQELKYTFRSVDAADISIFDDLETETRTGLYPFWFFPPDTGDAARFVHLGSAITRRQSSPNPFGTGQRFDVTLSMVEALP